MEIGRKNGLGSVQTIFMETFGLGRAVSLCAILFVSLVILFAVFWFFHSAPPDTITITSGPEGSVFWTSAEKYRKILLRSRVKLKILPSEGALQNLERLSDPTFHADIGFVQGGVTKGLNIDDLVSLGSISFEPLLVFYRTAKPLDLLSQLAGKRVAVGRSGSGTRALSMTLLEANGITPGSATTFEDMDAEAAAKALIEGKVDAAFLMGDVASGKIMLKLFHTPGIRIFDFVQADAYTRRIVYLHKLDLPMGSVDFGKNMPPHDIQLIGPTVELVARDNLHPALCDLLLEAATEIHGKPGLFKHRGEFPAPWEHEFSISPDATRFYKSGKGFLYRFLPFWVASLMNRIVVVFVPVIVVLIPVLRFVPGVFRWRTSLRISRWYRALIVLEQDVLALRTPAKEAESLTRLDRIEEEVNKMKIPASFGNQFYVLREHIRFVRSRLTGSPGSTGPQ
jgi:TRAP-type uncharacterized transport system substrate-binding protein